MPRTATRPRNTEDVPPTAAIITLLQAIERVGPDAPAAIAYRSALARKGAEAVAAGGTQALVDLRREIALSDPDRAFAHGSVLDGVWARIEAKQP